MDTGNLRAAELGSRSRLGGGDDLLFAVGEIGLGGGQREGGQQAGKPGYFTRNPVPQTSKSAVSRVSKPADATDFRRPADLEIGDPAGLETCDTLVLPAFA